MKLLFSGNQKEFNESTILFQNELDPFISEIERKVHTLGQPASYPLLLDYIKYMKWPIRKLEYSFVLEEVQSLAFRNLKTFDAGCGVTIVAPLFAKLGAESYGGDFDKDVIDYMKKNAVDIYGSKVFYSQQDLTKLDFEDNYFDLITCISVLEHIEYPHDTAAVKEMLRVLKPGGKLIVTADFAPAEKQLEKWQRRLKKILSGQFAIIIKKQREKLEKLGSDSKKENHKKANCSYNQFYLTNNLLVPFREYIDSELTVDRKVTRRQISKFWSNFSDETRSYVSVGLVYSKQKKSYKPISGSSETKTKTIGLRS